MTISIVHHENKPMHKRAVYLRSRKERNFPGVPRKLSTGHSLRVMIFEFPTRIPRKYRTWYWFNAAGVHSGTKKKKKTATPLASVRNQKIVRIGTVDRKIRPSPTQIRSGASSILLYGRSVQEFNKLTIELLPLHGNRPNFPTILCAAFASVYSVPNRKLFATP